MLQFFKNEKVKLYLTYPFLILLIVLFLHSRTYSFDFSISLSDYLYSSWLFNYQFGFMQRGLIGNFLTILNIPRDYNTIRLISIFIFLTLFYLYYFLVIKFLNKLNFKINEIGVYAASIMFLSYASTQFIHEISRFDQIFQIFLMVFTLLLIKKINIFISFIYIITIIPIITLTHEAGLIIFMPTIWLLFYLTYKNKFLTSITIIITFVSLFLISLFGKITPEQADLLVNKYHTYRGFNEYAFRTATLSLLENFYVNFYSFINNKTYIPILLCIIYLYPFFLFLKKSISTEIHVLAIVLIASPLSLSLIAFDYFRWISLFLFNLTVVLIFMTINQQLNINLLKDNLKKYKKPIIAYGLISLLLGPLGVVNLFHNFNAINVGGFSEKHLSHEILEKLH